DLDPRAGRFGCGRVGGRGGREPEDEQEREADLRHPSACERHSELDGDSIDDLHVHLGGRGKAIHFPRPPGPRYRRRAAVIRATSIQASGSSPKPWSSRVQEKLSSSTSRKVVREGWPVG